MPTATLPLQRLSLEEKLRAIETLWADLSQHEPAVPLPEWHKRVLADREQMIQDGRARFLDWETAKRRIARKTT